jgi:hypothetical protein
MIIKHINHLKECTVISSLLMFPQNFDICREAMVHTMRLAPQCPLLLTALILLAAIIGHVVEAAPQGSAVSPVSSGPAANASSPPPPAVPNKSPAVPIGGEIPAVPNRSPAVPVGGEILLPPVAFLQNPVSGLLPQGRLLILFSCK